MKTTRLSLFFALCVLPLLPAVASVTVDGGIHRLPATSGSLTLDRPFDLEGVTIHFERTSASQFRVRSLPLQYEASIGDALPSGDTQRDLTFPFPFYDSSHTAIVISSRMGIWLPAAPPAPSSYQYVEHDFLSNPAPVIAPLLRAMQDERIATHFLQAADRAIVTWKGRRDESVDVQAVLYANGDIRFHYARAPRRHYGAAIVTSGNEPWRASRTTLGGVSDPAGDVSPEVPENRRSMLDIVRFDLLQVQQTRRVEFVAALAAPIDASVLPPGESVTVTFELRDATGTRLSVPIDVRILPGGATEIWTQLNHADYLSSLRASVGGNIVTLVGTLEDAVFIPEPLSVIVNTWSASTRADSANAAVSLPQTTRETQTDFSAADGETFERPLFEAFTLPRVNLYGVYSALASELGLGDSDVSHVAVFTPFENEMSFYAAGFAFGGQTGESGFATGELESSPPFPTLMNLGVPQTGDASLHVLLHEFAHRWLYHPRIMENGIISTALLDLAGHPVQTVHLPVAFPVYGPRESSTMGGGWLTDLGDGSFSLDRASQGRGFSWHELYLMGLASPQEAEPFFYVPNPSFYRPLLFRGQRRNVDVQQIIDAHGARIPPWNGTRRDHRVLFVLLERASDGTSADTVARLQALMTDFRHRYAVVTGSRGRILTSPPAPLAAPVASFSHQSLVLEGRMTLRFFDDSTGEPGSWQWDFGDGNTSSSHAPSHVYARLGSYRVTLTVSNGAAASSTSREIEVLRARVRPARRP